MKTIIAIAIVLLTATTATATTFTGNVDAFISLFGYQDTDVGAVMTINKDGVDFDIRIDGSVVGATSVIKGIEFPKIRVLDNYK